MKKGNPNLIGTRVDRGDLAEAASILDKFAALRGLKIAEVARVTQGDTDAVFARGES